MPIGYNLPSSWNKRARERIADNWLQQLNKTAILSISPLAIAIIEKNSQQYPGIAAEFKQIVHHDPLAEIVHLVAMAEQP